MNPNTKKSNVCKLCGGTGPKIFSHEFGTGGSLGKVLCASCFYTLTKKGKTKAEAKKCLYSNSYPDSEIGKPKKVVVPDFVHKAYYDYPAIAVVKNMSCTAYLGVPAGHLFHGTSYGALSIDELSFSGRLEVKANKKTVYPGTYNDLIDWSVIDSILNECDYWWFGFQAPCSQQTLQKRLFDLAGRFRHATAVAEQGWKKLSCPCPQCGAPYDIPNLCLFESKPHNLDQKQWGKFLEKFGYGSKPKKAPKVEEYYSEESEESSEKAVNSILDDLDFSDVPFEDFGKKSSKPKKAEPKALPVTPIKTNYGRKIKIS